MRRVSLAAMLIQIKPAAALGNSMILVFFPLEGRGDGQVIVAHDMAFARNAAGDPRIRAGCRAHHVTDRARAT